MKRIILPLVFATIASIATAQQTVTTPTGIVHEQVFLKRFAVPTTIEAGKTIMLANESPTNRREQYPLSIRWTSQDVSLFGGTVIGMQPRTLTWSQVKSKFDGDAVRIETHGFQAINNFYAENIEDAFAPRGRTKAWLLANSWLRYIRDDVVENDLMKSGTIHNCLVDSCFMFLSSRPGFGSKPHDNPHHVTISDSLVRLQAMPDNHRKTRNYTVDENGNKLAHGWFFKEATNGSPQGTVGITNTILRADQYHSRNKTTTMSWPEGAYENVTFLWMHDEPYLNELPPGVTMIEGQEASEVWRNARNRWIELNSWRFPNRSILGDMAI